MAHGEGPETEHGLQLAQVLAPGLLPLAVLVPAFDVVLGVRQRQQAFPLGGGQDGTTWHIY